MEFLKKTEQGQVIGYDLGYEIVLHLKGWDNIGWTTDSNYNLVNAGSEYLLVVTPESVKVFSNTYEVKSVTISDLFDIALEVWLNKAMFLMIEKGIEPVPDTKVVTNVNVYMNMVKGYGIEPFMYSPTTMKYHGLKGEEIASIFDRDNLELPSFKKFPNFLASVPLSLFAFLPSSAREVVHQYLLGL